MKLTVSDCKLLSHKTQARLNRLTIHFEQDIVRLWQGLSFCHNQINCVLNNDSRRRIRGVHEQKSHAQVRCRRNDDHYEDAIGNDRPRKPSQRPPNYPIRPFHFLSSLCQSKTSAPKQVRSAPHQRETSFGARRFVKLTNMIMTVRIQYFKGLQLKIEIHERRTQFGTENASIKLLLPSNR